MLCVMLAWYISLCVLYRAFVASTARVLSLLSDQDYLVSVAHEFFPNIFLNSKD
jgi:hypothetical protein